MKQTRVPDIDGKTLQSLRIERGYTQTSLASMSELSLGYLSQLERGIRRKASPPVLKRLAVALDVSIADLTLKEEVDAA